VGIFGFWGHKHEPSSESYVIPVLPPIPILIPFFSYPFFQSSQRPSPTPSASFGTRAKREPTHPQTTDFPTSMVVKQEPGDLELYAVHDTPKSATWSARGDPPPSSAGQPVRQSSKASPTLDPPYRFTPRPLAPFCAKGGGIGFTRGGAHPIANSEGTRTRPSPISRKGR